MGLLNILAPRQQVLNSVGAPLAGGQVFLYEPGTTTFISSFRDSGLAVPHTSNQAVRLSGSGRANIWISRNCDLRILDRNGRQVLEELNANPDALGVEEAGGLVPNGSFEVDTDADQVPDGYTLVSEAGSTNGLDTSESTDGAQSFRFTSVGPGGGSLTTTDFFPVNDQDDLRVNVDLRSTVTNVRNIVRVEWFDVSQVPISDSDAYDSTANPLVFTEQQLVVSPPANARFAKIRLIGIDPSVALAGSTYFDRLSVFYPAVVDGIFDNITIQNNDIISTNLNGDVNLTPNGTGRTVVTNPTLLAVPSVRGALDLDPAVSGNQDALINMDNLSGLNAGSIGYAGGDDFDIRNFVHGGRIRLQTEDAGGVLRNILIGDGDGGTDLYDIGLLRLRTAPDGIQIRRDGTNDSVDTRLHFTFSNGTERGSVGYLSSGALRLRNEVHSGNVIIEGETLAGSNTRLAQLDPDGGSLIHNIGVTVLQGTTPALGGQNINNQFTGNGLERIAGASDVPVRKAKTASTLITNDNILSDDPHLNGWALEADTLYSMEAYLELSAGDTAPDFRFVWQFSNAPQTSLATYINVDDSGTVTQDSEAMNVAPIVQVFAIARFGLVLRGLFRSNAGVGGTVDFQWAQNVSNANFVQVHEGSWMKIEKLT